MAYINTTDRPALLDLFHGLAGRVREARAKRRAYNITLRELSALSDRDLDDLGISRLNIPEIARESAYGA
ncbi:MAG: DUF1127 domain-containing protein [Paracoccaceae bacterium]|nr:DUF1127 domain-containing protein [Paracoccaceae bacterium]